MGGLGNQLFQIFTTLAYGFKHKRNIIFSYEEVLTTGMHRPTYWNTFLSYLKCYTNRTSDYYTNDYISNFPKYPEQGFKYSEIPNFEDYKEVMLYGYFQSYKYFESHKNELFTLIKLSDYKNKMKTMYPQYFEDPYIISMHFRLGDYKTIQQCHPIAPYEYYKTAMEEILTNRTNLQSHKVLYFCEYNDIADVTIIIDKLIRDFDNVEFIRIDHSIPDWQQMLLMSCCYDNIIANSSFSWWGSYFNQNENKIICYPHKWFGPSLSHDTVDLFPSEWKKIFW